ncbi:oligosaccharide flippase family protein [Bacillus sp. ISL-34]|uniref:oligosaccharide flippase family protein n=1 Tax=Bacillus sp. ISL-34 TaxID=2819121 RepID=UPI002852E21A|nr:oligosaccharide flippase family protein [Bacillus sp. ISL-34]
MISTIKTKYIKSGLIKNLSVAFTESIITKILNFINILLLSRILGPEDYGKYSFIFVAIATCSAFFDFGMENTAVRFAAREQEKNQSIFGFYIFVKLIIIFFFSAIFLIFGEDFLTMIGKSEISVFSPYLVIGFVGESLLFINDTYLQAIKKFKARAKINIIRYLITLGIIICLSFNNLILLKYVVFLYFIPLLISLFFLLKYVSFLKAFFLYSFNKQLFKEILVYQKWMILISIPNNIIGRIDFFLVSLWVTYKQLGIYNVAFQISAVVSFLPFVFGKVLLPKMAELSEEELEDNFKKIFKPTVLLGLLMLLVIPLVNFIVPLIFGDNYLNSIVILQVMLISAIVAFIIVPLEQVFYSIGKPNYITVGKYVQISIILILSWYTIPTFGMLWAAISVLIARVMYGFILMIFYYKYKRSKTLTNI